MTTPKSPIDDVPGSQRIGPTSPIGEDRKLETTTGQSFSSFMQPNEGASSAAGIGKTPMASPFDLAHGQSTLPSGPNFQTLLTQVNGAQSTLGDLNMQLSNPNLKLKQSSKYLLKNKLSDANTHLHAANSKMGAPLVEEEPQEDPGAGPIARFIGYVTSGQHQLEAAKQHLQAMKDQGQNLKPGDLLLIQVQLNLAQQSLEYSSVVLSKAMDDIKMLMNVQL